MKRIKLSLLFLSALLINISCNTTAPDNQLSKKEKRDGWLLLFDGKTTQNWRGYNSTQLPSGWKIENGTLMSLGKGADIGGDIVFDKEFENFILKIDWKISKEGNSGIFYHIKEGEAFEAPYHTAPEYQLIDDEGFPIKLEDWQKTGANYAMHPANVEQKQINPVGQWNKTQIVYNNGHVEHWLNGKKIVEFEANTPKWQQLKQEGKWCKYPNYGTFRKGLIGLQDHGSYIWFKNIKIKEL